MKIAFVIGTRPEIIKMSPVIRQCEKKDLDYLTIHTRQHYSYEMDRVFFEDLELSSPKYNLDAGSGTHAQQTGKMMIGIEDVLEEERPDMVLVQGDTNTVLAGTLVASKMHIKVGHIEAGLRSFDRTMPEEINRVVVDQLSNYLFAPTKTASENLLHERIPQEKITITGNTIVDSVYQNLGISRKKMNILEDLGLDENRYFLATTHRAENVDNMEKLRDILNGLCLVSEKFSLPVIFPVHPRTRKRIEEFNFDIDGLRAICPVGFLEFLQLEANARLVLTDSGGVQEETCILGVPCVTLRENTERPETLVTGSNILAGSNAAVILKKTRLMMKRDRCWKNPFGDGRAAELIINELLKAAHII